MVRFTSQRYPFLALLLFLLLVPGCSETQEPPEEIVRSIKTISVSRRPIGQLWRLFGVLYQTVLVAPIEGLIAERRREPFQEISTA